MSKVHKHSWEALTKEYQYIKDGELQTGVEHIGRKCRTCGKEVHNPRFDHI